MLGLINAVTATFGAIDRYVKQGLVMANRFLTPPKITHPAQGSAEFDGASDYIDTGAQPLTDFTNYTYSFWVYFDDVATYQNMVGFGNSSSTTPVSTMEIGPNPKILHFHRDDAGVSISLETQNVSVGNWYFATATKEGTAFKLYLDGSLEDSGTASTSAPTYDTFNIGRLLRTSPQGYYNGNLANVAIWNRALSSDEINSVMWKGYDALEASEKSGLQAWYKLQESELFDITDTSTTNLEKYAKLNSLTFEGKDCLQTALNGFPDITDARMYAGKYDIRVSQDGGDVESLSCVETELNALL